MRPNVAGRPPRGCVAAYLGGGTWHGIDLAAARRRGAADDPAAGLDAAALQETMLAPVLQVADVRTDPRVRFVGGERSVEKLQRMVDAGEAAVAFSLAPVTTGALFAVSDAGGVMPPKSTWFEPKLRDGLLIHRI